MYKVRVPSSRSPVSFFGVRHINGSWIGLQDVSGKGLNLTPVVAATDPAAPSILGMQATRSNTTQGLYTTSVATLQVQRLSAMAWIIPETAAAGANSIISHLPRGAGFDGRGYLLSYNGATFNIYWQLGTASGAFTNAFYTLPAYLRSKTPILIVGTYDGVTSNLYVNGLLVASTAAVITISYADHTSFGPNPQTLYLGAYHDTTNTGPTGATLSGYSLLQVAGHTLFNKALTFPEISSYYRYSTDLLRSTIFFRPNAITIPNQTLESITLTDSLRVTGDLSVPKLSNPLTITDTTKSTTVRDRKLSSTLTITDTITSNITKEKKLEEAVTLTDTLRKQVDRQRATVEPIVLTDITRATTPLSNRRILETLALTDTLRVTGIRSFKFSEAITISDTHRYTLSVSIRHELFFEIEPTRVWLDAQPVASMFLTQTIFMITNFAGTAITLLNSIAESLFMSKSLVMDLATEPTASLSNVYGLYFNLLPELATTAVAIEYRVLLDGIDVTDKVSSCRISYSLDSYVGELDIEWADWTLYSQVDCSNISANYMIERIEVYTRVASNITPTWILQGKFFLEKRTSSVVYNQTTLNSWGRSRPAVLSMPYAKPLTKMWMENSTARAIATDLCQYDLTTTPPTALALPVTLSWEVADYPVLGTNIDVESIEPVEIISTLASTLGAILTCTKEGVLRVMYRYDPVDVVVTHPVLPPDTPEINGIIVGADYAKVYFS